MMSRPDRTEDRTRVVAYGLVMLTAFLIVAAIYTSSLILQRQAALREVSRYNATWLVSQAALEVSRLTAALAAFGDPGTATDADEVQLRLDIVLNRVRILTEGDQGQFIQGRTDLRDTLSELDAAIDFFRSHHRCASTRQFDDRSLFGLPAAPGQAQPPCCFRARTRGRVRNG